MPGVESRKTPDSVKKENARLLQGTDFSAHEYIFSGSAQAEFRLLLDQARRGEINADVVARFMSQSTEFTDMVTFWGIGYIIDQDTHNLERIKGQNREQAFELIRAVNIARENLLHGAGIPTAHIWKNTGDGRLQPILDPIALGSQKDLIEAYLTALDNLFSYYESFFASEDIIRFCQERIDRIDTLLASGNSRGRPLDEVDIERENRRRRGLQDAIDRHLGRQSVEGMAKYPELKKLEHTLEWPINPGTPNFFLACKFGQPDHITPTYPVMHEGLDIQVPKGTQVRASEAGQLRYCAQMDERGLIDVQFIGRSGVVTRYCHLDPRSIPKKFQQKFWDRNNAPINPGELIGIVGEWPVYAEPHRENVPDIVYEFYGTSYPHLHLEMNYVPHNPNSMDFLHLLLSNRSLIDPLLYLKKVGK